MGAILAGGGATRLGGAAKGLERVAGERIVDRVAAALRRAADVIVLVASAEEAPGWLPGVRVVPDVRAGRGSLVGLHAALSAAPGAGALVVAWDMPFASAALLRYMRELGERTRSAVVPTGVRGPEPLCAYYPPGALAAVERQLDRGEMRLGAMIEALERVIALHADDVTSFGDPARLFMNVNAPGDLERARELAE